MKRIPIPVVGHAEKGEPIFDGRAIFRMVDEKGLPLDVIRDVLRHNKMGFAVLDFVAAARESGNFSDKKLRKMGIPEEALV